MIVFSALLCGLLTALPPDVKPDLLPGIGNVSDHEIELAGLASLYPGRVLHEEPHTGDPGNAEFPPRVLDLPRDITYVRVYDLAKAVSKISDLLAQKTALIIDLRYVYGDTVAADSFADALSKAGLESAPLQGVGNIAEPTKLSGPASGDRHHAPPVVLVMVNGQTAGPLEARLAAFQEKESVLAVGTPTSGQPGEYQLVEGVKGYFVMTGEWRTAAGSVAGAGLKPRFAVDVTPEQNYRAYFNFEHGEDIANLLRPDHAVAPAKPPATPAAATGNATTSGNLTHSGNTTTNPPAAAPVTPAAPADDTTDAVLQRAVDVVAALQVLNRTPSSSTSGASSGTTAQPAAATAPAATQP